MVMSGNTLYGMFSGGAPGIFAISVGPIPLNVENEWNQYGIDLGVIRRFQLEALLAHLVDGIYTNVTGAASPYITTWVGSEMFFRHGGELIGRSRPAIEVAS